MLLPFLRLGANADALILLLHNISCNFIFAFFIGTPKQKAKTHSYHHAYCCQYKNFFHFHPFFPSEFIIFHLICTLVHSLGSKSIFYTIYRNKWAFCPHFCQKIRIFLYLIFLQYYNSTVSIFCQEGLLWHDATIPPQKI